MSKIRVKVSCNEKTYTYGVIDFTATETDYKVGDFYNHEEIKEVTEIQPDIEARNVDDYKLVRIITTYNGEFTPDDYCEEYLAIRK